MSAGKAAGPQTASVRDRRDDQTLCAPRRIGIAHSHTAGVAAGAAADFRAGFGAHAAANRLGPKVVPVEAGNSSQPCKIQNVYLAVRHGDELLLAQLLNCPVYMNGRQAE